MSGRQIAELKQDLDANRDKSTSSLRCITPSRPEPGAAAGGPERQIAFMRKAGSADRTFQNHDNIAYVLAAHEHLYYNPQAPDNMTDVPGWTAGDPIRRLVSGGAGAPLNEGKWGFYHYLIFTVDGDRVSVKLVKLQSAGASS